MAQLKLRNDVQWRAVKEAAEDWDHKAEGLTEAATAIIALAVTIATQGAGASLLAGTSLAGNSIATSVVQAAVTKIATTASISLINNKGDLGAVFKELGSSTFIKGLATSVLTAGLTSYASISIGTFGSGSGFAALPGKLVDRAIATTISTSVSTAIDLPPENRST